LVARKKEENGRKERGTPLNEKNDLDIGSLWRTIGVVCQRRGDTPCTMAEGGHSREISFGGNLEKFSFRGLPRKKEDQKGNDIRLDESKGGGNFLGASGAAASGRTCLFPGEGRGKGKRNNQSGGVPALITAKGRHVRNARGVKFNRKRKKPKCKCLWVSRGNVDWGTRFS